MNEHILVITDDENSELVRVLLKQKIIPITRQSLQSAIQLMRHIDFSAVVIDKIHHNVDTLEFILNARDFSINTPIFIPEKFFLNNEWRKIKKLKQVHVYDNINSIIRK